MQDISLQPGDDAPTTRRALLRGFASLPVLSLAYSPARSTPGAVARSLQSLINAQKSGTLSLRGRSFTVRDTVIIDRPTALAGPGLLSMESIDRPLLEVRSETATITGAVVRDLTGNSPHSPNLGGGTRNNHFVFKFEGVTQTLAERLTSDRCDVFMSFQYGAPTLADRSSQRNVSRDCHARGVAGIGLQVLGDSHSTHSRHRFEGDNGRCGRAMLYGVRMVGVRYKNGKISPSDDNRIEATVSRFDFGLSLQNDAARNRIDIVAIDCENACYVTAFDDPSRISQGNVVKLVARGGVRGIYDCGGRFNSFDVDIEGVSERGIVAENGRRAGGPPAEGNRYRGSIRNFGGERGAQLLNRNTIVDLVIEGRDPARNRFGLTCGGEGLNGRVSVSRCGTGVAISGDKATLSVTSRDCTVGLECGGSQCSFDVDISGGGVVITGNGNRIRGAIAGKVRVSGNNNVFEGRISGPMIDTGVGNRFPAR